MSDAELIAAAVEASGLSSRRFAERVISRDERTVRLWRAGSSPIPPVARAWLARFVALSDPARSRVVAVLDR